MSVKGETVDVGDQGAGWGSGHAHLVVVSEGMAATSRMLSHGHKLLHKNDKHSDLDG